MREANDKQGRLAAAALAGVRWVALGRLAAEVIAFGSSVVLARLIAPAEFGVVALAMVVQALAVTFAGLGIASALVQRERVDDITIRVATTLSVATGAITFVGVFLAAPLLAGLVGERSASAVQLIAPILLAMSFGAVPTALMQRELDFRALTTNELTASLVGVTATLVLALLGLNAEAIILGAIVRGATQALAAQLRAPAWRLGFDRTVTRDLLHFGIPAALSSVGNVGTRNVDYAIVAAQLGAVQTGFYWRAYQLAFEYPQKISTVMQKMAFPLFSRARDLDAMRSFRYRVVRLHGCVMFPLLTVFVATAPDLVPWLYGDAWEPAVQPAQILALAALAVPILAGLGGMMLAAGQPRALMIANWVSGITFAGFVLVAAPRGIVAVAVAVLAHVSLKVLLSSYLLMQRILGIRMSTVAREAFPGLLCATVAAASSWIIVQSVHAVGGPRFVALALALGCAVLVHALLLRWLFAAAWRDFEMLVGRVVPRRALAPYAAIRRTARPATAVRESAASGTRN